MSDFLKVLNERTSAEHFDSATPISVQERKGHLEADGFPVLDASELDFYLFNREARMDEVWESS